MTKTRLTAAERRAVILDSALAVFAERGYEASSVAELAGRAGVTKPIVYDHFTSKGQLYVALVEREATAMAEVALAGIDPEAPLEERLRALAGAAVRFARGRPRAARLLTQTPVGEPRIQRAHMELQAARRRAAANAILADPQFQARRGWSRTASAELLGDLHNAVLERLVRWAIDHPAASVDSLSDAFVEVLWTGLSGKPAAD